MGIAYELPVDAAAAAAARGDQRFFYLDPPLQTEPEYDAGDGVVADVYEYVIVSAADVPFTGPETYIFPATPHGAVLRYADLPGSFRGALDHRAALYRAGYDQVVDGTTVEGLREIQRQAVDRMHEIATAALERGAETEGK